MMNFTDILGQTFFEFIIQILIFIVMVLIGVFVLNIIKNSDNRFLNMHEYLPDDEVHTLKQVFYLIMMAASFIMVIYSLTFVSEDLTYFVIFDIALSLFIAVTLDKSSLKNKILVFFLIPFGSLSYIMSSVSLTGLLDIIHILVFIYFIKFYFDKFREYTRSNGLGIAIILLFSIVLISFFITQVVENVNALDSMVMVSNAFTSNGYSVLGHSIPGKINSLFLVWGGYIISGAGTATLTAAILIRHFNKRFEELKKVIDEEVEQ